ncbi:MAG: alpha-N-arabinofuranosidase [Acidobacteria bacterium]|nr:MAG: alpha-N-arabinofuranosidase [Acidobacteriota bacterium]
MLARLVVVAALVFSRGTAVTEAPETTVAVDVSRTRPPISPYVYGQFIEHLGRCIYGGLWAEMLEDRKFFYPVDGQAPPWSLFQPGRSSWEGEAHAYELLVRSPWLVIGDRDGVTMDRQRPYVGEQTPVVRLSGGDKPGGLVQERLGLVEGRRYVGRIVLGGAPSVAPVRVSLVWGGGASDRQTVTIDKVGEEYAKLPLAFTAAGTTDNGRLEIAGYGQGSFRIGAVSLMPEDNLYGWRSDTVARLKELAAPVYRWPGGNFVSGYDWKDGIGERDRRPPRKNPAWKGVEPNDVGLDEFMALCREIGAEPYVAVNTGLGGPEGAAEEVEYANGSAESRMGRRRAENGHPRPYAVKWWGIGNEMYGQWQLGHMPLAQYVEKHQRVVEAMRAVDPSIRPVAVGSVGEWSHEMLGRAASYMSLISEHIYWQNKPDVPAHVEQVTAGIRRIADAHRGYRKELASLRGKDVRIALDEWNYWYGPYEYGELGTRYFLQDALGIAAGLHELFRNSDLFFMANYAQTVNVIGAIKTTKTQAELEPTALVLQLYRQRFGVTPLEVTGDYRPLDLAAALSDDARALTVAVVNPTDGGRRLRLAVAGRPLAGDGRRWVIAGPGRWAHNRPGAARQVDVQASAIEGEAEWIDSPALSVVLESLWLR